VNPIPLLEMVVEGILVHVTDVRTVTDALQRRVVL
jgi:hypothetical protein